MAESHTVNDARPARDVVVLGASAGGIDALSALLGGLPEDLPAALAVTLHLAPGTPSVLARILNRAGSLPVRAAEDGLSLTPGTVLVAQPDHHLVLQDEVVRLDPGPRVNRHRPSIDVLFSSAAAQAGPRAVAALLSGAREDGVLGCARVREAGGVVLAQDPDEAGFGQLPQAAIDAGAVDEVLPLAALAERIVALAGQPAPTRPTSKSGGTVQDLGPTEVVCPDCGGALHELTELGITWFICHVGHEFGVDALVDGQREGLEAALWTSVRILEERAALLLRLAEQARQGGRELSERQHRGGAEQAVVQARTVRALVEDARG